MRRLVKCIATVLALGAALVSAACIRTGPDPAAEAREKVRGDVGEFSLTTGQPFRGELLAVTDATFVLFANQRVTIAPRSIVERIVFGWSELATGRGLISDGDLAALRHRSRFPYGITSATMAGLLRTSGQSSPDTLGKARR
jgi:hypothetical protein